MKRPKCIRQGSRRGRGGFQRVSGLWGLLLVIATFAVYQPVWNGKPIWDDAAHLVYPDTNPLNGLVRIWIEPGETQQYYPLVHSVFWLEHKLWGDATLLSFGQHPITRHSGVVVAENAADAANPGCRVGGGYLRLAPD